MAQQWWQGQQQQQPTRGYGSFGFPPTQQQQPQQQPPPSSQQPPAGAGQWWQGQQGQTPYYNATGPNNKNAPGYGAAAANTLNAMARNNTGGSFQPQLRERFRDAENNASRARSEAYQLGQLGPTNSGTGAIGSWGDSWTYSNIMSERDPFTGIQIQGPPQAPVIPENAPDWWQAPAQPQQQPFSFGGQEYGALQQMSDRYTQALGNQNKYQGYLDTRTRTPQQTRQWNQSINKFENSADLARRGFADMMGQYLGQDFGGSDPMALLGAHGGISGFDPYLQNLITTAVGGM